MIGMSNSPFGIGSARSRSSWMWYWPASPILDVLGRVMDAVVVVPVRRREVVVGVVESLYCPGNVMSLAYPSNCGSDGEPCRCTDVHGVNPSTGASAAARSRTAPWSCDRRDHERRARKRAVVAPRSSSRTRAASRAARPSSVMRTLAPRRRPSTCRPATGGWRNPRVNGTGSRFVGMRLSRGELARAARSRGRARAAEPNRPSCTPPDGCTPSRASDVGTETDPQDSRRRRTASGAFFRRTSVRGVRPA